MAYREIWEIEVRHKGLNKYRHIRGSDRSVVDSKARAQQHQWDEMWEKKLAAEEKKRDREAAITSKEENKELAIIETNEAQEAINRLEAILAHTLTVDDAIDWSDLLDNKQFASIKPKKPIPPKIPREPKRDDAKYKFRTQEPKRSHAKYQRNFLGAAIFGPINTKKYLADHKSWINSKEQAEAKAEQQFLADHKAWTRTKQQKEEEFEVKHTEYSKKMKMWQEAKSKFEKRQKEKNKNIFDKKEQYVNLEPGAICDYCEMVLSNSGYPDYFPQEWDIDYQGETKVLIVDYSLPDIESLPTTKEVKYVISRDEFTKTHLSRTALNKLYDGLLYQIALRTIHELYEADVVNALDSVVFNGWVGSVDKATGKDVNSCIMSIQASKDEFLAINLSRVDPKACFKQLKGVGSSKLHGLSPIAPIINIDKKDRRFTSAYEVVDEIDEFDNLAAMDWQDFENLIREVFEKEFISAGGEVKITQASRDGGVDAVAFDPDPIRGGKIVIQAKRYTNVVGVSAVRDLYGTTVNEGATKGILVTTADYGPDAYEFAKGKPLTLLNGSNLLHLLEKHGHKAKIDLKEAKKILSDEKI